MNIELSAGTLGERNHRRAVYNCALNSHYLNDKLEEPIITTQSTPKKHQPQQNLPPTTSIPKMPPKPATFTSNMIRTKLWSIQEPKAGNKNGTNTKSPKKPSSTREYIYSDCGQSIRATKTVNIIYGNYGNYLKTMAEAI